MASAGPRLSGEAAAGSARERAANHGGYAHFVRCDVTERTSVEAAVQESIARYGKLDILHNNTGGSTLQDRPVTEAPEEEFWRAIKLDLFGTFRGGTATRQPIVASPP